MVVFLRIFIVSMSTTKRCRVERVYLHLKLLDNSPTLGKFWQELKAGTKVEAIERNASYWLVLHGLFSLFSYRTQDQQPRSDTNHRTWALLHQSPIKKMHPQACPEANLVKAFSQLRFPLSKWLQPMSSWTSQRNGAHLGSQCLRGRDRRAAN